MAETTYSIPRWRYLDRGDLDPERCLFRQARNADLGTRGEIYERGSWRPLGADERLMSAQSNKMPQIDNDWVR